MLATDPTLQPTTPWPVPLVERSSVDGWCVVCGVCVCVYVYVHVRRNRVHQDVRVGSLECNWNNRWKHDHYVFKSALGAQLECSLCTASTITG